MKILAAVFFCNMTSDLIPSEGDAYKNTEYIPVDYKFLWLKWMLHQQFLICQRLFACEAEVLS